MALSGMLPLLTGRREFLVIAEQLEAGARPWVIGPGGAAKAFVLPGLITRLSSQTPSGRIPRRSRRGGAPARRRRIRAHRPRAAAWGDGGARRLDRRLPVHR